MYFHAGVPACARATKMTSPILSGEPIDQTPLLQQHQSQSAAVHIDSENTDAPAQRWIFSRSSRITFSLATLACLALIAIVTFTTHSSAPADQFPHPSHDSHHELPPAREDDASFTVPVVISTPSMCSVADANRVECGYYGIQQAACESRACCWSPTNSKCMLQQP